MPPSPRDVPPIPGSAISDQQSRSQVVEPAKHVVTAANIGEFTAYFGFDACTDQGVAPFRGVAEVFFRFPDGADESAFVEQLAATLLEDGWTEGPPPGKRPFGRVVHHGDLMAIIAPSPDHPGQGQIKIYGECRNANDHRADADEDIAAELKAQR